MTIPFDVEAVQRFTGADWVRGDRTRVFDGVSIDSRSVTRGGLFVAIRGEVHDAHRFLADAARAGAAGVLVAADAELPELPEELCVLAVPDTTSALGALAAGHRAGFEGPVIAITGSNGKTTTKEMCAAILSTDGPCLKTHGNLNNQFGLPLTLLSREPEHRAAVVEIGMNHRGEIAPLAAIARPDVGVITNVGTAHIEFLGSQQEIALEKGDLIASLDATGVAVLNADDPLVAAQAARTEARVSFFGIGEAADVRATRVTALGERGYAFDLEAYGETRSVHVLGLGETTVPNALAAAAAALAAEVSLDTVAEGLARYQPVGGRMEKLSLPRNIIVINDTYNANPQSVAVALRSLARLKGSARGIAVLGDMGELGETAAAAHRANGRLAAELGLDFLFALGKWAEEVAGGARDAGMSAERVRVGRSHEAVVEELEGLLQGDDWVLVKGSRAMEMERVVQQLAGELD